jgi:arginyl-tRNA synthetase
VLLAPAPEAIRGLLENALREIQMPVDAEAIVVERPKNPAHGHYASNVALVEAKRSGRSPREIADRVADRIARTGAARVDVAGPGFLNFTLPADTYHRLLARILADPAAFLRSHAPGRDAAGRARRVLVEFVSANPTGPLNVVSARAAAVGDTLARALEASGFEVAREFYVNDHGNQADLLGASVAAFLDARSAGLERPESLPEEGYGGAYVGDLAAEVAPRLPAVAREDRAGPDDGEIDALHAEGSGLFERAERRAAERGAPFRVSRRALGLLLREFALERILAGQREDLAAFGVRFDRWFRESDLHRAGAPRDTLDALRARGHVYEADGAIWFRTTALGDDQDRVLAKTGGVPTYFLADIAYHNDKFARGYDTAIDLWGPDHHGHVPRMRWATEALGAPAGWLEILIVQQVNLMRDGEVVKMSKRRGEFVTLSDLVAEVGADVSRWFFLMRRCESHLDFDLDLARKQSDENPVFYVQYAHARIAGLFAHARETGASGPSADADPALLAPLVEPEAIELMRVLQEAPAAVCAAALEREPHRLTVYLTEVATAFHGFYHRHQIVVPGDARTTGARLALCRATQAVIREALGLLGVSAPERM